MRAGNPPRMAFPCPGAKEFGPQSMRAGSRFAQAKGMELFGGGLVSIQGAADPA